MANPLVHGGDPPAASQTFHVLYCSSSPVAQPGGAPQPSPECDAGSPVASWLQAGSQTFGPGEGPDALMDDVDGLGETGGTAGVGQDVDSTSLR